MSLLLQHQQNYFCTESKLVCFMPIKIILTYSILVILTGYMINEFICFQVQTGKLPVSYTRISDYFL